MVEAGFGYRHPFIRIHRIQHASIAALQRLCREARQRPKRRPGVTEVHNDLDRGREEVQIRLNRALARKYGVSPQSVAGVLAVVVRGQRLRGYRTGEGEVEIWVRLAPGDRNDLEDLKAVIVGTGPDGRDILLSQVADLDIVKTPGVIQREDRRTFTWMWVNYTGDKKEEGKKHQRQAQWLADNRVLLA